MGVKSLTTVFHKFMTILFVFNKRWRLGDVRLQPVCVPVYLHDANLGVSFSISPLWWSVILGESHQLQHVESILSALDILQNILYAASFSSHAIQCSHKEILM